MNDFVDEDFYYKRSVGDDEVLQCIPPKLLKKLGKAKSGEFDQFMDAIHSIYKNSNRIGRMYSWMQNAKCETAGQQHGSDDDKQALCDQMPGCHSATMQRFCSASLTSTSLPPSTASSRPRSTRSTTGSAARILTRPIKML